MNTNCVKNVHIICTAYCTYCRDEVGWVSNIAIVNSFIERAIAGYTTIIFRINVMYY